jgi:hypothetical protein
VLNSPKPALLFLVLPICVAANAAPVAPNVPLPGPVIYEVRSWGQIVLHWQIDPDGSGEIWRGSPQKGGGDLRKYRLRLERDALRTFTANAEDVREATRAGIPCDKEIYDLPYGSVTWDYPGAKQAYSFDAGCRSEAGDEALDILGAASTVVETMARIDAKPYIVESAPNR